MAREDILRAFIEALSIPRKILKVLRAKRDLSDDILERKVQMEGMKDGVIHSVEIEEKALLFCGHLGNPGFLCRYPQEGLAEHWICGSCAAFARQCQSCRLICCPAHVVEIEGVWFCLSCAEIVKLECTGQRLISWVDGWLQ
ncbi:hypothetical protein ACFL2T_07280 [Elusimicrobiota bacterium]